MSDALTITNQTNARPPAESPTYIVLFDGVCGLCNHTVDFLLQRDQRGRLRFAPLQGETAAQLIPQDVRNRLDTMVYVRYGQLHYRSAAIARMLRDLGGFWGIVGFALWLIPAPLRDIGYRCVSALRYRLFGKHESCRMPTPDERSRFLD